MALGLVGRKVGMTRIFTEDGVSIPVTVIEATLTVLLRSNLTQQTVTTRFKLLQARKKQAVSTNQQRVTSLKLALKRVAACGNSVLTTVKVNLK